MKADNITLQGILNSPNRYTIPVFQRYYTWGIQEWALLWENLMELAEEPPALPSHFLGALVFVPERQSATLPTYLLIDGQQRLMTLTLLLAALRNIARSRGCAELASEISDTYLTHPYKKGTERYRLFPRQRDRDEYLAIVEHRPFRGERGVITETLIFFANQIRQLEPESGFEDGDLRRFFEMVTTRLDFVYITLDQENPYRIFKSLNSTGVNLSEADLIRNYILMEVGRDTAAQDHFDAVYWRPLEEEFVDEAGQLDSRDFSQFFRDFLMAEGKYVPLSATFYHFERRFPPTTINVRDLVATLQESARLYNIIRGQGAYEIGPVNRALHKLRLFNGAGLYPLLLSLMQRLEADTLSEAEFLKCTTRLERFLKKQMGLDEPPRGMRRWFVTAAGRLQDAPYANLHAYLETK